MNGPLRTVVFENRVSDAIQHATERWPITEEIIRSIEWAIVHDPQVGEEIDHERGIRGFIYPGARSINEPDVDVIYEIHEHTIVIHQMIFSEPVARHAGHA